MVRPAQLHPWVSCDPAKEAEDLGRRADRLKLFSNIAKIAAVALLVLAVASLFFAPPAGAMFSLAGFSFSRGTAVLTSGVALLGIALKRLSERFESQEMRTRDQAAFEWSVVVKHEEMKSWDKSKIEKFLLLSEVQIPGGVDLHTLLPLIARYRSLEEHVGTVSSNVSELRNAMGEDNAYLPTVRERVLSRRRAWQQERDELIPSAIFAALALKILAEPYSAAPRTLSELGTLSTMSFEESLSESVYGGLEPVFVTRSDLHLSFQDFAERDSAHIRNKLFPLNRPQTGLGSPFQ